jgi:5-methylcytosine-specific restriction enzyme A
MRRHSSGRIAPSHTSGACSAKFMPVSTANYTRPSWGPWFLTPELRLHYTYACKIYIKFEDLNSLHDVFKHVCITTSTVYNLECTLKTSSIPFDAYLSIKLRNAIKDILSFSDIDLEQSSTFSGYQAAKKFINGVVISRRYVSPKKRMDVFEKYKFKCAYCGATSLDGVSLEVDHIIPISRGGSNELENLQILCRPCNSGKSDRIINFDRDTGSV